MLLWDFRPILVTWPPRRAKLALLGKLATNRLYHPQVGDLGFTQASPTWGG